MSVYAFPATGAATTQEATGTFVVLFVLQVVAVQLLPAFGIGSLTHAATGTFVVLFGVQVVVV